MSTGCNNSSKIASGWLMGNGIGCCIIYSIIAIEYCTDNVGWSYSKIRKILEEKDE
jgi:hypothetical protein